FVIKGIVGIYSNSIAVISDAINSLNDIIASAAILYGVKISLKNPDEEHQFGHNAAQPIAVFLIALFAGIVGIEVIKASIERILHPYITHVTPEVYVVLVITIIIKLILMQYQSRIGKKYKSPGLKASAVDSMNDVLASSLSIIGVIGVQLGLRYIDGISGILIALFIFRSGYKIAKENIDYLMGKAASEDVIIEIANKALRVKGVEGINELKSHYVGNKFHVEIHIDVHKDVSTEDSHDIGVKVREEILHLPDINKVFVHIDPV
ncbi:MAG: cation diffusion facilitator family transporter, partial [Ignavibacteriaceae bacterium]